MKQDARLLDISRICLMSTLLAFILGNGLLLRADAFAASAVLLAVSLVLQSVLFYIAMRSGSLALAVSLMVAVPIALLFIGNTILSAAVVLAFVVMSLLYLRELFSGRGDTRWLLLIQVSVLMALVVISAKSPVSFDMMQRIELGTVHRDSLFHASIAAMIKHYGVVSTGLSGLVETPYHALSHMLLAAISSLSGIAVIEVYGVIPLLLLLPLLMGLYAWLAVILNGNLSAYRAVFFTALVLAIAPRILKVWGLKESYFGSESYMLSLVLLAPVILLLMKPALGRMDLLLLVVLAGLTAMAKATVGVAVIGLVMVRLLLYSRQRRELPGLLTAWFGMIAVAIVILLPSASANVGAVSVAWWEYVRQYSLLGSLFERHVLLSVVPIMMFLAFHFLLNWIVIRNRYRLRSDAALWQDDVLAYNLAAIAGAMVIVMLPLVTGSSAYYFSGAAMFVALPWLVPLLAGLDYSRVRFPLLTALVLVLVFKGGKLADKSMLEREAAESRHGAFVQQLVSLRESRNGKVIYRRVPGNALYADNPVPDCAFRPFVYPAITETAWLDVIHEPCDYYLYGYMHYLDEVSPASITPVELVPQDFVIRDI